MSVNIGMVVVGRSGPGVLHELTGVIAHHNGDIASVSIIQEQPESRVYFEINLPEGPEILQAELQTLPAVRRSVSSRRCKQSTASASSSSAAAPK